MTEKLEMPVEDFAVAVSKENERLRNILYDSGIVEIAAHNNRVTEYMFHWEGRALEAEAEVELLRAALREAYEVYAGSDGFIPETASEGYQQQIIKQMVNCISTALKEKSDE